MVYHTTVHKTKKVYVKLYWFLWPLHTTQGQKSDIISGAKFKNQARPF